MHRITRAALGITAITIAASTGVLLGLILLGLGLTLFD